MQRNFANPYRGDDRDYGDSGEVERLVREALESYPETWFFLPDISRALQLDRRRLERVLWRLYRKRQARMRTHELGYTQWQAA
jgi:hypothetical protein